MNTEFDGATGGKIMSPVTMAWFAGAVVTILVLTAVYGMKVLIGAI